MTKTAIFNRCLGLLGQALIVDSEENSPTAKTLRTAYDVIVNSTFESLNWNFAMDRVALAKLSSETDLNYASVFQLPADYARLVHTDSETKHEINGDQIKSNDSSLQITYIKKLTDPSLFTDSFANYISIKLAEEMSYNITAEAGVFDRIEKLKKEAYRAAKKNDGQISNLNIYLNKQYSNRISSNDGVVQVNIPDSAMTAL